MNKFIKATAFLAGTILVHSASAQSALVPNDLYMGFQNQFGGGSADYIVNLGSISSLINANPATPVNLSGDFSLADFTSSGLQGTNAADILGGAVGGSSGNPADIFVTEPRNGSEVQALPGSKAPTGLSKSSDVEAYNSLTPLNAPGAGTGVLDTSLSWQNDVEPNFNAGTFWGVTGINPDSSVTTSGVTYEDLWGTSSSGSVSSFSYEGYFTIDFTGSSPDVTFTPAPEPSSYLLSGAGGFLMLLFRNRLWRKNV